MYLTTTTLPRPHRYSSNNADRRVILPILAIGDARQIHTLLNSEKEETRLKASALLDAIRRGDGTAGPRIESVRERRGFGR